VFLSCVYARVNVYLPAMTRKEAFGSIIGKQQWYISLGIKEPAASAMVSRFRKGTLSIEKMEEVLKLAGFVVVVEESWGRVNN
jgi:hypothetical protein